MQMAESKEELRSLLRVGLILNIQKTKIMAYRWGKLETVAEFRKQWQFIFLGPKITAEGDCSHEIKRHLLLRSKIMTNLDSILKSRHITWPTKAHIGQATIFLTSLVAQTVKLSTYNGEDLGLIPGSGRSPGEGNGNPLQYSCLENPMDGGAW